MSPRPHDTTPEASTPGEEATRPAGNAMDTARDDPARDPGEADDGAELAAIGAEIDRIKASVSHIAEATSHYVKRRVTENSTDLISENPLRAVLWAAFAGFLIGRLSR